MILGVIPARGGSKGIPQKNIKEICGRPLIAWTIRAALDSKLLDDFVVSTEDPEIKGIAQFYGAKVIDRPQALATDEATTVSALGHVVEKLAADVVVVLQPTSPVRGAGLIDRCIERFIGSGSDCLATGYYCKYREYGTYDSLRRQDYSGFFYDDGNVYILKKDLILAGRWSGEKIERFITERDENYEIDDETDFFVVEKLLERRLVGTLRRKLKGIKLLAMDVDGVLTDCGMYYAEGGDEQKKFNTRDGKGIELLRNAGFKTAIITQEDTAIVKRRAEKLGMDYVLQGQRNKAGAFLEIARREGLRPEEMAFIGDDVNDTEALMLAGFSATPADGHVENKKIVDYVCSKGGGGGCVRELCDLLAASKDETSRRGLP